MRKDKFIELIRRSIPTDHNPAVIDGYISLAYNAFVKNTFMQDVIHNEYFTKLYEGVDVEGEANNDYYFATIPATILSIRRPGGGVWSIDTTGSYDLTFVPIPDMTFKIIENLTALKVPSHIPYVNLGNRVQFRVRVLNIEKVNMRLLVEFGEYDAGDDIQFPGGAELQIRELVMNYLLQKIPEVNSGQ
jgi:hypothetical protein